MDFQTSIKTCFKKYATFSGRALRSEFWYFWLFSYLTAGIIIVLSFNLSLKLFWLLGLFYIGTLIPFIAVTARRLHDVNKSGWFQVLPFPFQLLSRVPNDALSILSSVIGIGLYIYLLVLYCTNGDKKDNRFGKNIYKKKKKR